MITESVSLLTGILSFVGLLAQSPHDSMVVEAQLETNQIRIGEQIRFTIIAKYARESGNVLFPSLEGSVYEGFEVIRLERCDTLDNQTNGNDQLTCTWLITSFDSGTRVIPPWPVVLSKPAGNDTVLTPPLLLEVSTVEVNAEEDIRDIKDIMAMPWSFREIAWKVLLILAVLAALVGAYWFYVRWRKGAPLVPVFKKVQQPPHVIALEKLESLRRSKLWQQGRIKAFHSELTDILRVYMEARFQFPAPEMVTSEIIQALEKHPETRDKVIDMEKVLQLADLVKFARENPLPDEHERSLQLGLAFVKSTIPEMASASTADIKEQQQLKAGHDQ